MTSRCLPGLYRLPTLCFLVMLTMAACALYGCPLFAADEKPAKGNALHGACTECNLLLVNELIAAGVDVNQKDRFGDAPLHKAAMYCEDLPGAAIVKVLLEAGADPETANEKGLTPIQVAVEWNRKKSTALMVEQVKKQ